jgi:rod shape-determining protein MreD
MVKRSRIISGILWAMVAILEVSLIANLRINNAVPYFLLIILVFLTLNDLNLNLIWQGVVVGGVILDLFQPGRLGLMLLALACVIGLVVWLKSRYLRKPSVYIVWMIIFASSGLYSVLLIIMTNNYNLGNITLMVGCSVYSFFMGIIVSAAYQIYENVFLPRSISIGGGSR